MTHSNVLLRSSVVFLGLSLAHVTYEFAKFSEEVHSDLQQLARESTENALQREQLDELNRVTLETCLSHMGGADGR